jgi:hypothetical protein
MILILTHSKNFDVDSAVSNLSDSAFKASAKNWLRSRTRVFESIFSPNLLPGIRVDGVIQIQLVRSLLPLHPEVHDSGLWFFDVHAVFDLGGYAFHGIIHLALGISCNIFLKEFA